MQEGEVENLTMRRGFIHRKGWEERVSKLMMKEKSCGTIGSSKEKAKKLSGRGTIFHLGLRKLQGCSTKQWWGHGQGDNYL